MNLFDNSVAAKNLTDKFLSNILPETECSEILKIMEPMRRYPPNVWHKWNAYEHSNQVCLSVLNFMDQKYENFPDAEVVRSILNQTIDGTEKWRILSLAGLLHDAGKGYLNNPSNASGHTKLSLQLLDDSKNHLNLTEKQFEFLRILIANHHKFDRIVVSEDYEFTRRFLPDTEYLCESSIFSFFDIKSCQGPAYTDHQCPYYTEAQNNLKSRRRLISALIQENYKLPALQDCSFTGEQSGVRELFIQN